MSRRVEPTPEVAAQVRRLCEGWQDTDTYIGLMALVNANLLSGALCLGNGNLNPPPPEILRVEAADIRCSADGLAQFFENLADRIEARGN